jgi:hypothetical protein
MSQKATGFRQSTSQRDVKIPHNPPLKSCPLAISRAGLRGEQRYEIVLTSNLASPHPLCPAPNLLVKVSLKKGDLRFSPFEKLG